MTGVSIPATSTSVIVRPLPGMLSSNSIACSYAEGMSVAAVASVQALDSFPSSEPVGSFPAMVSGLAVGSVGQTLQSQ